MTAEPRKIEAPKTILCVEDEAALRRAIAEELRDDGFHVLEATNGRQAVTLLEAKPVDLILSDIRMPEMDGFDLLSTVRARGNRFDEVPFIFLTALSDDATTIEGLGLGADDYLTKPIDFDALLARIRARLRQVARVHDKYERDMVKLYTALGKGAAPRSPEPDPPLEDAFLVEMKAHARGHARGRLGAGRVQFFSLGPIRDAVGDDAWDRVATRVIRVAETAIKEMLGPKDLFTRYRAKGFMLLFPGLTETEARVKTDRIASDVAHRLLGEDADLFDNVGMIAKSLDPIALLDADGAVNNDKISDVFADPKPGDGGASWMDLREHATRGLRIDWRPVWNLRANRVACHLVEFSRSTEYGAFEGTEVVHGGIANPYLCDLDNHLLTHVADTIADVDARVGGGTSVFMVPVHWPTVTSRWRQAMLEHLRAVSEHLRAVRLIIELRGLPADLDGALLAREISALEPLCGGVAARMPFPGMIDTSQARARFLGVEISRREEMLHQETLSSALAAHAAKARERRAHSYGTGVNSMYLATLCRNIGVEMIAGTATKEL